jgi:hypothetical protein
MKKPNLFVIGAAKCGTSTLHTLLGSHSQVFMSEFKEPAFFLGPTTLRRRRRRLSDSYRNNPAAYFALFGGAGNKAIVGESSTAYTTFPHENGVAERIHAFNPEARLIYIVRDPVQRTISHYWWRVRWEEETRDIYTAITQWSLYCDVSNYAMQLKRYLQVFSPNQIMVVTLESLSCSPHRVLADIFGWLGVDPSKLPPLLHVRENVGPLVVAQQLDRPLLQWFRNSRLWDTVGAFVPQFVRRAGRSLVEKEVHRASLEIGKVIDFLRPIQLEETRRLCELVGREFPEWSTLFEGAHVYSGETPALPTEALSASAVSPNG